jgi:hypothetical protein
VVETLKNRFRTHSRYIEALAHVAGKRLVTKDDKALQEVADRTAASGCLTDKSPSSFDANAVHTRLRNAWGTELLLAYAGHWAEEDELVRLSNTWGVVQAYYVGYHATQALALAKGMPRPDSHPKTQNIFSTLWCNRPLDLAPWSLGCTPSGPINAPGTIDHSISPWVNCDPASALSLAYKPIRTTRDDDLAEAIARARNDKQRARKKAWNEEVALRLSSGKPPRKTPSIARPLLTSAEKQTVDRNVGTYSILHYLYRLRIRSNYEDAALFTEGPSDESSSALLHGRLRYLVSATMLVHELRILNLVGASTLRTWATEFASTNVPGSRPFGVAARLPFLT